MAAFVSTPRSGWGAANITSGPRMQPLHCSILDAMTEYRKTGKWAKGAASHKAKGAA
jgi:hypothetical protein